MKIEHIALYVNDLEAARDFFIRYFGALSNDGYHNVNTDFQSFFLRFENGARLEIMKKPGVFARDTFEEQLGYAHIAFSLGSKEKVDALTEQLQTDGYRIVSGPRITGDGYYESCIIGIENNRIELTI